MMIRSLAAAFAVFVSTLACASDAPVIDRDALLERIAAGDPGLLVLDVRTAQEYAQGHVPGALNISHDELEARIGELEAARSKEVVVYCRSGRRSGIALGLLEQAGFANLRHLEGDWLAWSAAEKPVALPAVAAGIPQ